MEPKFSVTFSITLWHLTQAILEVFDFALTEEAVITLDNMAQKLTIMDPTAIQAKIDNPLPDGYKLKLVKKPVEP